MAPSSIRQVFSVSPSQPAKRLAVEERLVLGPASRRQPENHDTNQQDADGKGTHGFPPVVRVAIPFPETVRLAKARWKRLVSEVRRLSY